MSGTSGKHAFDDPLQVTAHRPYPLQPGPWRLRQRWYKLLFAHWRVPVGQLQALLPAGLEADVFDGSAWIGVVPFSMDQVQTRVLGQAALVVPTVSGFDELNLRTYVRSRRTGKAGVFFYSLDCTSLLAVLGARTLFHLPYYPARMQVARQGLLTRYSSRRWPGGPRFAATYEPTGDVLNAAQPDSLEHFLTERYCLFTPAFGSLLVGEIHHLPWPLQPARADIALNEIPQAHGFGVLTEPPVLHYAEELYVNLWALGREH